MTRPNECRLDASKVKGARRPNSGVVVTCGLTHPHFARRRRDATREWERESRRNETKVKETRGRNNLLIVLTIFGFAANGRRAARLQHLVSADAGETESDLGSCCLQKSLQARSSITNVDRAANPGKRSLLILCLLSDAVI